MLEYEDCNPLISAAHLLAVALLHRTLNNFNPPCSPPYQRHPCSRWLSTASTRAVSHVVPHFQSATGLKMFPPISKTQVDCFVVHAVIGRMTPLACIHYIWREVAAGAIIPKLHRSRLDHTTCPAFSHGYAYNISGGFLSSRAHTHFCMLYVTKPRLQSLLK